MFKQEMVPDSAGTIGISGFENLVDEFLLKHRFLKHEEQHLDKIKSSLRETALSAIRAAQKAGAKRAFIRASERGGASITLPDYDSAANRPTFSKDKMTKLMKAGGLESLGLKPEEVFEEERTEGGEQIVLRGRWIGWFMEHYGELLKSGQDPDLSWEKTEPSIIRRVKASVLPKLEAAAAAGSAVAQLLIEKGFKALTVRAELK